MFSSHSLSFIEYLTFAARNSAPDQKSIDSTTGFQVATCFFNFPGEKVAHAKDKRFLFYLLFTGV